MKILFTRHEEKSRGINFILKSLTIASKEAGNQNGLIVGYPAQKTAGNSNPVDTKIEHVSLQRYLKEGVDSFKYFVKGGLRKRNILKAVLNLSVFKTKKTDINKKYFLSNADIVQNLDFIINSPYYYQFLTNNYTLLNRRTFKKIVRKYGVDLILCISPTTLRTKDVRPAKLAHFVHDAMPYELVESPPDDGQIYAKKFRSTAMNSDLILTNSKDTASKVLEVNPRAKVHVLYGTASSQKDEISETSILQKKDLSRKGYLLFASTLEKRKNVEKLIDGYAMVAKKVNKKLVLVGAPGYGFREIHAKYMLLPKEIKKNVIFTGYIPEADKYTLYKNALAFVFPSIYEGIGLVIIEAMMHDLPVITSKRGALPEAGGKAAIYIDDPYDPSKIAQAIEKVVTDKHLREKMIKEGRSQVKKFTQTKFNQRFKRALTAIKG